MSRTRKKPDERRESILEAALQVLAEQGVDKVTRADVATRAGVTPSLVSHYFGEMDSLRVSVLEHAVATKSLHAIAKGIASGHPVALSADPALRTEALATLM